MKKEVTSKNTIILLIERQSSLPQTTVLRAVLIQVAGYLFKTQEWKVNFLLTKSIHNQEKMLWKLMKWSPDGQSFHLETNSLNQFFKEMYGDQSGELCIWIFGFKGLK